MIYKLLSRTALVLALAALPTHVLADSGLWRSNNGNWGDSNKWLVGGSSGVSFPNGIDEVASFDNSSFFGGAGPSVMLATSAGLDTSITIGTWNKSSASGGRIIGLRNVTGGTGVLIFDVSSGNATYSSNNQSGSSTDTIYVGIQLNDDLDAIIGGAGPVTFSGAITESGGSRALNKLGGGSLTLSGASANSYTGGTSISSGSVSAQKNAALGSGDVTVLRTTDTSTATLFIADTLSNVIDDSASLYLTHWDDGVTFNYARVDLGAGVNDTIAGLYFDGIEQAAGTWGATGSGATFINDDWFTGTGLLTVIAVPEPGVASLLGLTVLGGVLARRRRRP